MSDDMLSCSSKTVKMFEPYNKAPMPLHRICTDLTYYPPTCTRREDLREYGLRDVATTSCDSVLMAIKYGCFGVGQNLKGVGGVSMIGQMDGHSLRAAHDLVRKGRRIPCLIYKQGAKAPESTAFVHDRVWQAVRCGRAGFPGLHFCLTPISDVELGILSSVANPSQPADSNIWQECPMASGELMYDPPPFPSDGRLATVILALEALALDEQQPDQLRQDARLLEYSLCYEHESDDDRDWTWVVDEVAPRDNYIAYLLKSSLDASPEPSGSDLNILAMWRLVTKDINDCWDYHHPSARKLDVSAKIMEKAQVSM